MEIEPMAKEVENTQTVDVGAMIDQLVANAEKALDYQARGLQS